MLCCAGEPRRRAAALQLARIAGLNDAARGERDEAVNHKLLVFLISPLCARASQLRRRTRLMLRSISHDVAIWLALRNFGLLERHSASRAGLLTERTRRALEKARPTPSRRHVEAKEPGELVCFDCFYIGKLKGVGKVWQITACDAASSYGLARLFLRTERPDSARVHLEAADAMAPGHPQVGSMLEELNRSRRADPTSR